MVSRGSAWRVVLIGFRPQHQAQTQDVQLVFNTLIRMVDGQ
jgi:hypothetical protein